MLPDLGEQVRSGEWIDDFVRRVLEVHGAEDVVLVGHGTAWTIVVSELTGGRPTSSAGARSTCPT